MRCKHKWKLIDKIDFTGNLFDKIVLVLVCQSCGKVKKVTVR